MPAAPPTWAETEEIPLWADTTEIVEERPPERADYVNPPPRPPPMVEGEIDPPWMTPGLPKPAKPYEEWTVDDWKKDRARWDKLAKLEAERGVPVDKTFLDTISEPIAEAQEGLVDPATAERMMRFSAPAATSLLPGVTKSLAETASGFTSPFNMLMLGAGGELAAIPKLGAAAVRGLAGGFTVDMGRHFPELWQATQQAETPEEKQKAWTDLAVNAGMTGLAGLGTVMPAPRAPAPIPPRIIENIAKADAIGLNRSAQALADTIKREQISDQVQQLEKPITAEGVINAESPLEKPAEIRTAEENPVLLESGSNVGADITAKSALPPEPARAQGGEAGQVLLKPVERFVADLESGQPISTKSAHEFGRTLSTPEEITQLKQAYTDLSARARKVMQEIPDNATDAEVGAAVALAQKPQFLAEAIDGATGADKFKLTDAKKFNELREAGQPVKPATPLPEPAVAKTTGGEQSAPVASQAVPLKPRAATAEFNKLLEEYSEQLGWIQNPDAVAGIQQVRTGASTASIKADIAGRTELATARRKAIRDLGGDPTQPMTPSDVAKLLPKLKEKIAEYEAAQAAEVGVEADLPAGSPIPEFLPAESTVPKLAPGEKSTGDLLKTVEEPLKLVGEKGVDVERAATEKATAETAKAEAAAIAAKAQPELPGTYAAGAKVIADKLRAQFKTDTGGKTFTGPVQIINAAVEVAAKIIEYGGSAADALAAGLKHIRQHSPADEAAFRSSFDEAFKAPTAKSARATLEDVYKIFEPAPKESKGISARAGETVESFRTGFSSKFRPLNKLAEDIASEVGGKAKDVAGIFEQLKGSSGKAEADVYRFDKDVSDLVKGSERDFNAYVFLRRSLDRLNQDAADITRAQAGEDVPNLNRRRVSQYTIPQLEAKLTTLSEQIGGEKLAQFNKVAEAFQTHMDQALRLQVESGRMSPEVYDAIKAGNQFYAPFKVMKYIEDTMRPEGSGRKVDTTADFVKAMEGIEDPNFKLGDMLAAARQNLTLSRTLAEKNRAMQNITELAALDVDGNFVQKLKPGQDAPRGMEAVNVMENGVKERYAVNPDVAQAIQNSGPGLPAGIVARWSSNLFRAGATTLNLAFQPVNLLMADAPRAALVSKYGVKGVTDLVRYPMDFVESLFSSIAGDVFGVKNKLFQDFLDSGAAGTTVQQYLTPEALKFRPESAKTKAITKTILNTIPQFANAIEQTHKVLGVKRAMRLEGVESGAALAKQIPEAITEIRRFSGSPDFGRAGKWTEQYRLNLIYMFLNARIQGAVADVGRLTGRDGGSRAAKTWLKMGTAVGIPTAYLYMLNNSDEYKEDYAKRPEQEKQNYWLIPKDTFITGANGEKMRDYWRVPKREIAQWMGNAVESGLDFANQRDPQAFWKWAGGMAESIAPVNIRGNTLQERGESVLSGTHPFIKAPIETATGRDLYRHRAIVPESQKKASPEKQYTERTAEVFKSLAEAMPNMAPEALRSPLMLENMTKNFTAGLLTQFLPRQPVEGRSKAENLPLTQRFQALPYTDSSEFDQRIQRFERESADEQLKRMRDAKAIMDSNKDAKPDVLIKQMIEKHGRDEKLAERIVDLYLAEQRGITSQERRVLALPVTQRAEYLADELKGKTPEQKAALLRNWSLKRVLTDRVAQELAPLIKPTPNPNP